MPQNMERPTPAEVKQVLQQAVLRSYPNPERKGCPGTDVLHKVAEQSRPPRDDRWEHIIHCSPCYREFLDCRHTFLRQRRRHRIFSRLLFVIIGLAMFLTFMY